MPSPHTLSRSGTRAIPSAPPTWRARTPCALRIRRAAADACLDAERGLPVGPVPQPDDDRQAPASVLEEELPRVLRNPIHPHLVVQVRSRGATGVAHRPE